MKTVLQFNEQQRAIRAAWRAEFDAQQAAMNSREILVGNALPIPIDAWRRIDQRAQAIARSRLAVYSRLAAANTTPVAIADIVSYYPQVSDSGEIAWSMDGRVEAKGDQALVKYVGTPIPMAAGAVSMGWRQMEVLRKGGAGLDITSIANVQRRMIEAQEDMALNGLAKVNVDGNTIYGLRNFPQRNTGTHGLTLASSTGAQWLTAVKQAITLAMGDNQYGRLTLFVNMGDYTYADTTDYSAAYSGTILQRLRAISQIADIVPASSVPANEILGVADLDTGEWGSVLSSMPLTTRPQFRANPEDEYRFLVLFGGAVQLRSDYSGQSPFVHLTTA